MKKNLMVWVLLAVLQGSGKYASVHMEAGGQGPACLLPA
jgi:hypothetical protein